MKPLSLLAIGAVLFGPAAWAAGAVPFPHHAPWFNVTRPLTNRDIAGRFVLLDFFTPGCINCIETVAHVRGIQQRFSKDLVVIGVNSPKFRASRHSANVRDFLTQYGIRHPVVTDRHFRLWNAYHVFAWPTFVLIGPRGHVRRTWIGQGHHAAMARFIALGLEADRRFLKPKPLPLLYAAAPQALLLEGPEKIAIRGPLVAVSDTLGDRVLLFDRGGRLKATIGSGQAGYQNGGFARARFNHPQGLAFGGSRLLVADTLNNAIRAIDLRTLRVTTFVGPGLTPGPGRRPGKTPILNAPWALRVVQGELYVAMAGADQLWRGPLSNGVLRPWAGSGWEGLADGPNREAEFAQPSGLCYGRGVLYVADAESSSVRAVFKGRVHTVIGRGLFHFGNRDGKASRAALQHDQGLAYADGNLYIADTFNSAVKRLDLGTGLVTTVAGDGHPGDRTGPALGPTLNEPGGLAVLNPHTLLIADTGNNRILALDLTTETLRVWAGPARLVHHPDKPKANLAAR